MIDFQAWREHFGEGKGKMPEHFPSKPLEKNNQGGFDPQTDKQIKRFKHADLITLPEDVKGTNCGSCRFVRKQGDLGFCSHPDIQDWVTHRMCCIYWDNPGVRRSWKKNSDDA